MKRYFLIALVMLLGAWLMASCSGTRVNGLDNAIEVTAPQQGDNAPIKPLPVKDPSAYEDPDIDWTWDLIAGQTTKVGTVHVYNDDENFYVEYQIDTSLDEEWLIHEVHVYIGPDEPTTGAPGQFTYVDDQIDPGVTYYLATIPFTDVFEDGIPIKSEICVAAHAVVCVEGDGGEPYGGYAGSASATMWAGQYFDSGDLTVGVDGDYLVVTYTTNAGWLMSETQLYVGDEPPPTSAPGQFPFKTTHDPWVSTYTYEIDMTQFDWWGDDVDLYVAAHAVVWHLVDGAWDDETAWAWPDGEGLPEDNSWHQWGKYFIVHLTWDWFGGDPTDGYCETAWGGPLYLGTQGKEKGKWQWGDNSWDKKWGGWFCTGLMPFQSMPDEWVWYKGYHWGPESYWKVEFLDTDSYPFPGSSPYSYYVSPDGNYWVGWCVDPSQMSPGSPYKIKMYSCYDPGLPAYAQSDNWDMISYIITMRNEGQGIYNVDWSTTANIQHFQNAVWYFKYGTGGGPLPSGLGGQIVADAIANGDDFIPGPGEYYAVILWPGLNSSGATKFQMNIIEVDP